MAKCKICNRQLRNPKYIALGMGPVCARKNGIRERLNQEPERNQVIEPYQVGDGLTCRRDPSGTRYFNVPQLIVRHSPTGMEWGYSGSGPSDLALNTLYFFTRDMAFSNRHYQEFKERYISGLAEDGGAVPLNEITNFIQERKLVLMELF